MAIGPELVQLGYDTIGAAIEVDSSSPTSQPASQVPRARSGKPAPNWPACR